MAVPIESVQIGKVFDFKNGPRGVMGFSAPLGAGFNVRWEYADGVKRNGKIGGSQWIHYFRKDALREVGEGEQHALVDEFKASGHASYVEWLEAQVLALRSKAKED